MKILYVITKSNWGGAQRYVYDLAIRFSQEGNEVLVTHGGNGLMAKRLAAHNVRTTELPIENDFGITDSVRTLLAIRALIRKERPDIVHLNSSKAAILGRLASFLSGKKRVVFTLHGWPFDSTKNRFTQIVLKLPIYFVIAFSHATIAVSQSTKQGAPSVLRNKMTVIHNGITCPPLVSKVQARELLTEQVPALKNLSPKTLLIGTIAELHPVKGLGYAIRAIKALSQNHKVAYIVCGEGSERSELEKMIRETKTENIIFLPGFIPDAAHLLPAFDIVLHPSLSEACAYAVLETGCAGLPVAGSRVGGIPEIVEDGVSGLLFPAAHTTMIGSALKKLVEESDLRKKLGNALRKRITEHFSLGKTIEETWVVYLH